MTIHIYQEEDRLRDSFHDDRYVRALVVYLQKNGFTLSETIGRRHPSYHLKKQITGERPKPPEKSG